MLDVPSHLNLSEDRVYVIGNFSVLERFTTDCYLARCDALKHLTQYLFRPLRQSSLPFFVLFYKDVSLNREHLKPFQDYSEHLLQRYACSASSASEVSAPQLVQKNSGWGDCSTSSCMVCSLVSMWTLLSSLFLKMLDLTHVYSMVKLRVFFLLRVTS